MTNEVLATLLQARAEFHALIGRPAQLACPQADVEARQARRLADQAPATALPAGPAPAAAADEPAAEPDQAPAVPTRPAPRQPRKRARRPVARRGALALPSGASWGDDAF